MASSPQSNGVSPRPTDVKPAQAQRITKQFRGCSRIADYEILGKLGEGTFGYLWPLNRIHLSNHTVLQRGTSSKVPQNRSYCRLEEDTDAQREGWSLFRLLMAED
jgi:hypothetical protein